MKHLLCTLHGPVDDKRLVKNALLDACREAGAMVVGIQDHSFFPEGYSAVVLLGESHASIHTWPDLRGAALDFFCCSSDPNIEGFLSVWDRFGFVVQDQQVIERSIPGSPEED